MTELHLEPDEPEKPISVGRYLLHRPIARGGMATIHIARVIGDVGFSRIVAAKRLRPELAQDREFVQMFLDEARIASKVHHRNVVPVLDVGTNGDEVVLVQELVHGAPLSLLLRAVYQGKTHVPIPVVASIACQVLAGLHAAHETLDELGAPLHIIHRDVSPQNIMIATDGSARLLDFGIAKASASAHVTRRGTFKGKLAYAAPEQLRGHATQQSDVYALAVVLWELVVGDRLYREAKDEDQLIVAIMKDSPPRITDALASEHAWMGGYRWGQLEAIEPVIHKGLAGDPRRRWQTAAEMEEALAAAAPQASPQDVAAWLRALAGDFLAERERVIAAEEASWRASGASGSNPAMPAAPAVAVAVQRADSIGEDVSLSTPVDAPVPELRASKKRMFAFGAGLSMVMMAFALWVIGRGGGDAAAVEQPTTPAATQPQTLTPTLTPTKVPTQLPAAAVPAPAVTTTARTVVPTKMPTPLQAATTSGVGTATVQRPRPVPQIARAVRAPAPKEHEKKEVVHVVKTAPPPAAVVAPPPSGECNPPYYYEGEKKFFKPACL